MEYICKALPTASDESRQNPTSRSWVKAPQNLHPWRRFGNARAKTADTRHKSPVAPAPLVRKNRNRVRQAGEHDVRGLPSSAGEGWNEGTTKHDCIWAWLFPDTSKHAAFSTLSYRPHNAEGGEYPPKTACTPPLRRNDGTPFMPMSENGHAHSTFTCNSGALR